MGLFPTVRMTAVGDRALLTAEPWPDGCRTEALAAGWQWGGVTAGGRVAFRRGAIPRGRAGWWEPGAREPRWVGPEEERSYVLHVHPREERMLVSIGPYMADLVFEIDLVTGERAQVNQQPGAEASYLDEGRLVVCGSNPDYTGRIAVTDYVRGQPLSRRGMLERTSKGRTVLVADGGRLIFRSDLGDHHVTAYRVVGDDVRVVGELPAAPLALVPHLDNVRMREIEGRFFVVAGEWSSEPAFEVHLGEREVLSPIPFDIDRAFRALRTFPDAAKLQSMGLDATDALAALAVEAGLTVRAGGDAGVHVVLLLNEGSRSLDVFALPASVDPGLRADLELLRGLYVIEPADVSAAVLAAIARPLCALGAWPSAAFARSFFADALQREGSPLPDTAGLDAAWLEHRSLGLERGATAALELGGRALSVTITRVRSL